MEESKEIISSPEPEIIPASSAGVQLTVHRRVIHVYPITDDELNEFSLSHTSIDFGLLSLCIGVIVPLLIVLLTTQLADKIFVTFICLAAIFAVLAIFFGYRALQQRQRIKERIDKIKSDREIES